MHFTSQGRPFDDDGMDQVCDILGVSAAEVWAVLTVETRGFGYLQDRRPLILFERHQFHKRSGGRHSSANPDISNPTRGGYKGGSAEYPRLEKAIELDRDAALASASWGIAQIMGFNHAAAGFPSVEEFINAMVRDELSQLTAMAAFINEAGMATALRGRNWTSFARKYNGPKFSENQYDTRLAAAHAKFSTLLPDLALRTAQAALLYLGLNPGPVDGLRGRKTRSALSTFQNNSGLAESGELDEETFHQLMARAFPA